MWAFSGIVFFFYQVISSPEKWSPKKLKNTLFSYWSTIIITTNEEFWEFKISRILGWYMFVLQSIRVSWHLFLKKNKIYIYFLPKCYQMRIICWSWDWNRSGTTDISMTQLKCELLKFIGVKMVVIPKNMVMGWSTCTLYTLMWTKVKVKFRWMGNSYIYSGASWNVTRSSRLFISICTEKTSVMAFLHHNESDTRLKIRLQFDTSFSNSSQFMLQDLSKLTFGDSISVFKK